MAICFYELCWMVILNVNQTYEQRRLRSILWPHCISLYCRLFQKQNRDVGEKLVWTTAMMFTLPIITYFITMHIVKNVFFITKNVDNYAGGAAILVTNIIIGGYCYMAYHEDDDENGPKEPPKVGRFKKERTD